MGRRVGIAHTSANMESREIKAEPEDEEECFMVEDDDIDERSDTSQQSQSRHANEMMMMAHSWPGPEGDGDQGFNMSELDFQQQVCLT